MECSSKKINDESLHPNRKRRRLNDENDNHNSQQPKAQQKEAVIASDDVDDDDEDDDLNNNEDEETNEDEKNNEFINNKITLNGRAITGFEGEMKEFVDSLNGQDYLVRFTVAEGMPAMTSGALQRIHIILRYFADMEALQPTTALPVTFMTMNAASYTNASFGPIPQGVTWPINFTNGLNVYRVMQHIAFCPVGIPIRNDINHTTITLLCDPHGSNVSLGIFT